MDSTVLHGVASPIAFQSINTGGLIDLLVEQARLRPQAEAVVCGGFRVTYGQLAERAMIIARQLGSLSIGRGDKVGLLFPNSVEYVAAFFAITGLGATVVPVNPLLKSEEIAHILSDSQARCFIVHEAAVGEAQQALAATPAIEHVLVGGRVQATSTASRAVFHELASNLPPDAVQWPVAVEPARDLAVIVYTSGTTGKPKGAMLTHANLHFTVALATNAFQVGPADRFIALLPLCHIYGLTVVMLGILSRGGTVVILEKFEAAEALSLIELEKITVLPAVPTMYQFMIMEMEKHKFDVSSLRVCISGAASLPVEIFAKIENQFGAPLIEGYGLTEVSCLATFNRLDGERKVGSVGCPFDGVAVSLVDETGAHIEISGQVGEIVVKGPNVMSGYFRQPEASEEAIQAGWFYTGDLAYKDESGYFFIVGRKKELIIRGGQNIYPREIEEVIARLPAVLEVAVVGVPDRYMGERVKAVVVRGMGAELSEAEVKEFCARHLAEYKVPRLVQFVDALPRNSTGKILKRLLV
jgi:long-chain acyl-CoA synthetase